MTFSLALPLFVLLLRPLRWHLVYRSLRDEVGWFRHNDARILVGVGPGGAIIAGMIAKLMAEVDGKEPAIDVVDRVYSVDEYSQVQVSVKNAESRLNADHGRVGVIIVTSEIHGGGTIIKVCDALRQHNIEAPVFSFLWSTQSSRLPKHGVDRFVIRADQRGLLPWPDAPAKESTT
ncbi:MAG: hypothetical protein ACYC3F_05355 [Gemmatimonadaceae bacterium]